MKYFSISSVEEAYREISVTTKEKFWGILGILHSVDENIYPNKYYNVESGKLSQYFEDLFRLSNKKNYSNTNKYSFMFSNKWINVVSEEYLEGKPSIRPILVWAFRNHSFSEEISIVELFNKFIQDYHITKEIANHLFTISFTDTLEYEDSPYSDEDLLGRLGGSKGSKKTLKLDSTFVDANAGDLSRGPYFQPLYAALNTFKCLTFYPFNVHDYYTFESVSNQEKDKEIKRDNNSCQVIFYGAPGTGKSKTIKNSTEQAEKEGRLFRTTFHPDSDYSTFVGCYKPTTENTSIQPLLDYDSLVDRFKKYIQDIGNITHASAAIGYNYHDSIVRMQERGVHTITDLLADAHKSGTTYDTTIRSGMLLYEEQVKQGVTTNKISYKFVPQAFTNAYVTAWNTKEGVYLIIEEINRGNCAQIFGDLFQLLDRGDDGRSEYPIDADSDLANYIGKELSGSTRDDFPEGVKEGKKLVLPSNLYIWATMNTSDQSLFPIDSAFKRRWDWKYIKISEGKDSDTKKPLGWKIMVDDKDQNRVRLYDWWKFLQLINRRIYSTTQSADKQMGYFFAKAKDHFNGKKVGRIIKDAVFEAQSGQISKDYISAETFVNKVLFYLWTDVMKDNDYEEITNLMEQNDGVRLTFPDFFGDSGMEINHASVRTFLDNVMKEEDEWCKIAERTNDKEDDSTVSTVSDEEIDDGLTEVDLKENGKKVNFSRVTFGDGTVIDEGDRFATYVAALKKFGLEKSAEIGENSKLHRQKLPLICKTVKQTPSSPYSYEEVDGIYIMKGTNSMHRMLIKIGKELNVTFRLD